jgi:hypothetical protein
MVIWDMEGVLMVEWLPRETTTNHDILQHHHSLSFENPATVQREIGTSGLLHDDASSHISHHTTGTLASFGFTVLPQPAYSPDLALSVMSCGSRWKSHCVVDSSQTVTTSRVVFARHGMLSWKRGVLQPSGSYQTDSSGVLNLVGSMWSVLWCGSATYLFVICEWPSHKKIYEN